MRLSDDFSDLSVLEATFLDLFFMDAIFLDLSFLEAAFRDLLLLAELFSAFDFLDALAVVLTAEPFAAFFEGDF